MTVKPFLKWAGGKAFLLPYLDHLLPTSINTYYEPMIGGGALFFHLSAHKRFKKAVISDTSPLLINTYRCLQSGVGDVTKELKSLENRHKNLLKSGKGAESLYYRVRDSMVFAREESQAAKFIYLNKTCYNGLYRVNRIGEFNVPYGAYKNPTICDTANLIAVHNALRGVTILNDSFEKAVLAAKEGDLVYFDPPYIPVKPGSFVGYTGTGFNIDEHKRLERCVRRLSNKGVHVLLSNSACSTSRKIFRRYYRVEVSVPRRINSNGKGRSFVKEYIFTP